MSIQPFTISLAQQTLDDLHQRLRLTRWPDESPGVAWEQGTDLQYLRQLLAYWADEFDWRVQERRLNAFKQFRAALDGIHIHFVHERAVRGRGIPLILTHGWPSTFVELLPLVPLLTDPQAHGIDGPAFDIVIASLPGYGWSERPNRQGVTTRSTALLWHRLMHELGYERYGAQGGDFGASVATFMALDTPEALIGLHLSTLDLPPYTGPGSRPLSEAEREYLAQYQRGGDVERRFSKDQLLTTIMIYWATGTITSSMRDYFDNRWLAVPLGLHDFVSVPTAVAVFTNQFIHDGTPPREWAERLYNVRQWTPMESGGHFAASEEPERLARDITTFFAAL